MPAIPVATLYTDLFSPQVSQNGVKLDEICEQLGMKMDQKDSRRRPMAVYTAYVLPISAEFLANPDKFPEAAGTTSEAEPFTWNESEYQKIGLGAIWHSLALTLSCTVTLQS